jgi:hypothetical protein
MAWLYLISVLSALDDITRLHLADADFALRQTLVGSQQELQEKTQLADQLKKLIAYVEPQRAANLPVVAVEPAYFADLADLLARLARRRIQATRALRVLEFVGVETVAGKGVSWIAAFPNSDPLEVKLASDVVRFLCRACSIDIDFVRQFDAVTGREPDASTATPVEATHQQRATIYPTRPRTRPAAKFSPNSALARSSSSGR